MLDGENNEKEVPFPTISDELYNELDRLFPEVNPENEISVERLWCNLGMRKVVLFLKFKRQEADEVRRGIKHV